MLAELSVMEQRYQAVLTVLRDGFAVTEVAQKWVWVPEARPVG